MKKSLQEAPGLCHRLDWKEIDPLYLKTIITLARDEDIAGTGLVDAMKPQKAGDATTEVSAPPATTAKANFVARKACTLSGLYMLEDILAVYGGNVKVTVLAKDGDRVPAKTVVATIEGSATEMLMAERIMLNFLQRMSGIATITSKYVDALNSQHTHLLDTRKTTPGHRVLDKYAVGCGGAWNHRIGLFDRLMLKDNHLAADNAGAGTALEALVRQSKNLRPDLLCEVEVDSLEQIPPVLKAGADIILLDNFSIDDLKTAVAMIGDEAWTEISGGVTLESLPLLGTVGADFVSCGALTHNVPWIDIGLDWI
ncbi:MAG: carboxylating nicotinate-nucleotide diphosphorylase [Opitutales bacterium]|nr:carboxylating nicotinate-nucleotide diphosphorylase [Opitutales bacterium]